MRIFWNISVKKVHNFLENLQKSVIFDNIQMIAGRSFYSPLWYGELGLIGVDYLNEKRRENVNKSTLTVSGPAFGFWGFVELWLLASPPPADAAGDSPAAITVKELYCLRIDALKFDWYLFVS